MSGHQTSLFFDSGIQCDKCGEISPNEYVHTLNHSVPHGSDLCARQDFALRHIRIDFPGTGQPSLAQLVTHARNLNIEETLIQKAVTNRRPPRPLTTL